MPLVFEGVLSDKDAAEEIDEELKTFDEYFQSIGNDPLVKFEIAAIKTFLLWKVKGAPRAKQTPVHGKTDGE